MDGRAFRGSVAPARMESVTKPILPANPGFLASALPVRGTSLVRHSRTCACAPRSGLPQCSKLLTKLFITFALAQAVCLRSTAYDEARTSLDREKAPSKSNASKGRDPLPPQHPKGAHLRLAPDCRKSCPCQRKTSPRCGRSMPFDAPHLSTLWSRTNLLSTPSESGWLRTRQLVPPTANHRRRADSRSCVPAIGTSSGS